MNVTVSGAGRLLGLDNGDSTDYDQYKGTSRRLFSGRLLAVIGATETAGDIRVKVQSPGLPECSVTLTAEESENEYGVSCKEVLKFVPTECGRNDEIPSARSNCWRTRWSSRPTAAR